MSLKTFDFFNILPEEYNLLSPDAIQLAETIDDLNNELVPEYKEQALKLKTVKVLGSRLVMVLVKYLQTIPELSERVSAVIAEKTKKNASNISDSIEDKNINKEYVN